MDGQAKRTRSQVVFRWVFYVCGMIILSMGVVLNTKSLMGVSPIISVPYVISIIGGFNFGDAAMVAYVVIALIEYVLKGRSFRPVDLLQIPLSFAITRFFNVFGALLPDATELWQQALCLLFGIALTGMGAAMNLNERLVPNPGDGVVQAVSDCVGKPVGICKNVIDCGCVIFCVVLGVVTTGHIVGVGVGTILAVVGVGRFMALYNYLFAEPTMRLAGMPTNA